MRLLIIVPTQDQATGNWVTAKRFKTHLEQRGHDVLLLATGLDPAPDFGIQATSFNPDVVLLLHAYRTGKPWFRVMAAYQYPVVVLLTGTDINLGLDDDDQQATIHSVMSSAHSILLQNRRLLNELVERSPSLKDKVHYLRPGILLGNAPFDLRRAIKANDTDLVFFCPAGIRAVKGVLELVRMFEQVAASATNVHLVFAGPLLEGNYGQRFLQDVAERRWAHYCGIIPPASMANALHGADVIVNNSTAEGLSNALLEAVTLGIPVLASAIPGNTEIITHGENGLLFNDSESFVHWAKQLIFDQKLRESLGEADSVRFSPQLEAETLEALLTHASN